MSQTLFKFLLLALLVALIQVHAGVEKYDLWYTREGSDRVYKKMVDGDKCLKLKDIDRKFDKIVRHNTTTGCKMFQDDKCEHKGVRPYKSIYCALPSSWPTSTA